VDIWHAIGRQLSHPQGVAGRLTGRAMRWANDRPTRAAVEALGATPGDSILDAGCGPGHAIALLARQMRNGHVTGFDRSETMIAQARAANARAVKDGRVLLEVGDFSSLPYAPGSFDGILASNVIYFWADSAAVIAGLRRLLRPGGRLIIYATEASSMARWKFARQDTHRHIDKTTLARALAAGGFGPGDVTIGELALPWGIKGLIATAKRPGTTS